MIDLWLAPLRAQMTAALDMQRAALALMVPPPMAAVTVPGDLARLALPWALWLPLVQVAGGMAPGPWAQLAVRMPMGTCGVVTIGGRR